MYWLFWTIAIYYSPQQQLFPSALPQEIVQLGVSGDNKLAFVLIAWNILSAFDLPKQEFSFGFCFLETSLTWNKDCVLMFQISCSLHPWAPQKIQWLPVPWVMEHSFTFDMTVVLISPHGYCWSEAKFCKCTTILYHFFFLKKKQLFNKNVGALDIEDTLF